jgi:hypothetical protein
MHATAARHDIVGKDDFIMMDDFVQDTINDGGDFKEMKKVAKDVIYKDCPTLASMSCYVSLVPCFQRITKCLPMHIRHGVAGRDENGSDTDGYH